MALREKTLGVHQEPVVVHVLAQPRHRHILKIQEAVAPEAHPEPAVQFPDRSILAAQPRAEEGHALRAGTPDAEHPDFIINLKAHDARVMRKPPPHLRHDTQGALEKIRVIDAVQAAAARLPAPAVLIDHAAVRQAEPAARQPDGRTCGGRAQQRADALPVEAIYRALKPAELKNPRLRLQKLPGKLGHPHHVQTGLAQENHVAFKALLGRMFRVKGGTEVHER